MYPRFATQPPSSPIRQVPTHLGRRLHPRASPSLRPPPDFRLIQYTSRHVLALNLGADDRGRWTKPPSRHVMDFGCPRSGTELLKGGRESWFVPFLFQGSRVRGEVNSSVNSKRELEEEEGWSAVRMLFNNLRFNNSVSVGTYLYVCVCIPT